MREQSGLRWLTGAAAALLTAAVTVGCARWIGAPRLRVRTEALGQEESCGLYLSSRVEDTFTQTQSAKRVYWINREAPAAPAPNPDGYGEGMPEDLAFLADQPILDGQSLYFSTDRVLRPGTVARYYLDDTILAITWKQVIDGGTYTFSEIRIAHPSQFRRFLAGGEFGSDSRIVTTEMAGSVNAVVASSGDFYGHRQAGTLVYDGTVRRVYNGLVDTCYIDGKGDLLFSSRDENRDSEEAQKFVDENDIRFSLAFGPVLIRDGQVDLPGYYAVGEIWDHYPRSALCQLGKLHYLLAVVNREGDGQRVPTLQRFGQLLADSGIRTAYTLDGGQTAVIAMDGQLINAVLFGYQRRISDIIYFATAIPNWPKKET